MILQLNFESSTPIYEQLNQQIIQGILTGKLSPGERLPSVRQLASDLGINLHTVNKSYNKLKEKGFIKIHRQKGVTISHDPKSNVSKEYLESLKKSLQVVISEALLKGVSPQNINKIISNILNDLHLKF